MAKKQPTRRTTKAKPSKPPKGTGGGGAASVSGAIPDMDSTAGNFSALMNEPRGRDTQAAAEGLKRKSEGDLLAEWKARKEKLHAAKTALRGLPDSEYEDIISEMIRTAPTAWHIKKLVLESVRWLKFLSSGNGHPWRGIPENNENVIANVHYELARITHEFNVSLTAKSTPRWLQLAKKHPAFQRAWKLHQKTKGEHEHDSLDCRVIEVDAYGGQLGLLKLRCVFDEKVVRMEWRRGDEVTHQETRERIPSKGVLQTWLAGVLTDYDKSMDYPHSPLSQDWAARWANEELYMKHFMPHAEQEWNPDEVDELQTRACGLLTTNNGKKDGKPRYDFGAFKTRIRRLAIHQIRFWRDAIVPPAPKV